MEKTKIEPVFAVEKEARVVEEKKERKPGKIRSQEYRSRKKRYLSKLEELNKELTEENLLLKSENAQLRKQISILQPSSSFSADEKSKVDNNENFAYFKIPKMINNNPDSVRLSQIEMAGNDVSEWSPDRVGIIKKAFNDILNYMLAKENKCFIAASKNMKMSDYIKRIKRKRAIKRKFKQLEDPNPEQMVLNMDLSNSMIEYIETYGSGFLQTSKIYKTLAKKLMTIRNEILQAGLKKEKFYEETNLLEARSKVDFKTVSDLIQRLDGTKYLSPHYLWDLPLRDPTSLDYSGCELSE
ncbi:unnamed protein product [Moneuplotes crassus]|uniref:BZIP domain-containing protein n=1 Tax=Euplotes crassus TaxID=5936 RepID=A0AAD2D0W4_EUPCR|nr:unnamed protein product [Moneuplotes crassus]